MTNIPPPDFSGSAYLVQEMWLDLLDPESLSRSERVCKLWKSFIDHPRRWDNLQKEISIGYYTKENLSPKLRCIHKFLLQKRATKFDPVIHKIHTEQIFDQEPGSTLDYVGEIDKQKVLLAHHHRNGSSDFYSFDFEGDHSDYLGTHSANRKFIPVTDGEYIVVMDPIQGNVLVKKAGTRELFKQILVVSFANLFPLSVYNGTVVATTSEGVIHYHLKSHAVHEIVIPIDELLAIQAIDEHRFLCISSPSYSKSCMIHLFDFRKQRPECVLGTIKLSSIARKPPLPLIQVIEENKVIIFNRAYCRAVVYDLDHKLESKSFLIPFGLERVEKIHDEAISMSYLDENGQKRIRIYDIEKESELDFSIEHHKVSSFNVVSSMKQGKLLLIDPLNASNLKVAEI